MLENGGIRVRLLLPICLHLTLLPVIVNGEITAMPFALAPLLAITSERKALLDLECERRVKIV